MCLKFFSVVPQSQLFSLKSSKLLHGDKKSMIVTAMGNATQASTATDENILQWVKEDKRRMLHVVYRVGDMDRTIK